MPRPFIRWLLFALCLAVFAGALLWISGRMLSMEEERRHTAREAQVQERVRLALWRMESIASAMLIRENARPASHYQPFFSPTDLYTSSNEPIPSGQALTPSPLLGEKPDLVKLHFEILGGLSTLCSPQIPEGKDATLANSWYVIQPNSTASRETLKHLETILQKEPELGERIQPPPIPSVEKPKVATPAQQPPETKAAQALASKDLNPVQQMANNREFVQRSAVVSQNILVEKSEAMKLPMKKAPIAQAKSVPEVASSASARSSPSIFSQDNAKDTEASPKATQELPSLAGDLSASWIDGHLFLFRDAQLKGKDRLQGIWVDWPTLRQRLLDSVRDLLPSASLDSAKDTEKSDPDALVTLPIKLAHGPVNVALPEINRTLVRTLGMAWVSFFLAAAAIAFVLQTALTLSERRGAFVSAVTHELRTPLTTFQLYSEMLAEDMVKDPDKRKDYLKTLHSESGRLMHLVENVLSFSRIERGRTAAREEILDTETLLNRMLPRLEERATACGLTLKLESKPEATQASLKVDPLAVEQILSNLVDNACKYAAPASRRPTLDLKVSVQAAKVRMALRDHGPGLPATQRKKLFQPFAKSASEAAHSAPGVGLGLALSKRLARELGGDLRFEPPVDGGTQFVLTIPVVS